MAGPIPVPQEDPSTSSRILDGIAPNGEPIVSVVFGMTFAVGADGTCKGKGYTLVDQADWEKAKTVGKFTHPSLLVRDADIWVWRNFTDIVVQGSARSDKPTTHLDVELSVTGPKTKFQKTIAVTGDRWVDKGPTGHVLSHPEPFTEMPLTYERAYGGTDELAEERQASEEILNYYVKTLDKEENEELSLFSYPRNAAGKGYLIEIDGLKGLPWPNLEFPDDKLRLDSVARPVEAWGDRPYPACFDWFHHSWFPRSAHLLDLPLVENDRIPMAERRLGLFEEGWEDKQVTDRSPHPFANGAHPYLCRERLIGDEKVTVKHVSPDGRDFVAQLPGLEPKVSLRLLGAAKVVLPASVDLVFAEPELRQIAVVWRATHMTKREHLPLDWVSKSPYDVVW